MTRKPGATPAALAAAATAAAGTLPFAWRIDRHDDPAPPTPPAADAPAPDPAPPAADPATPPAGDGDKPLGPEGEKALAAFKDRARAAEAALKAAQDKVREFEERDKSELERAQAAAARAEADAEAARAELTRTRIIVETGLSPELAEFLPTGDEDTVRAAATKLQAATTAPAGPRPGPRPDPSQGAGRNTPPADFRTASREDFKAELAKYGLRTAR